MAMLRRAADRGLTGRRARDLAEHGARHESRAARIVEEEEAADHFPSAEQARNRQLVHVDDLPGVTYSSRGDDRVDLGVVHDDGTLQARLDDEYGEGAVVVDSALRPVG